MLRGYVVLALALLEGDNGHPRLVGEPLDPANEDLTHRRHQCGRGERMPPVEPDEGDHSPFHQILQLVGLRLPPATLGRNPGQGPGVALLAPRVQVRRVEALAAEQGAELTRLRATIGLAENADLVLRREPPPHGPSRRNHVIQPHFLLSGAPACGGRKNFSGGWLPPNMPPDKDLHSHARTRSEQFSLSKLGSRIAALDSMARLGKLGVSTAGARGLASPLARGIGLTANFWGSLFTHSTLMKRRGR